MQTMAFVNDAGARRSHVDDTLRTNILASTAANAEVWVDAEALFVHDACTKGNALPRDGFARKVEPLKLSVANHIHDAYLIGLTGIDVVKIALLRELHVNPMTLLVLWHALGYAG